MTVGKTREYNSGYMGYNQFLIIANEIAEGRMPLCTGHHLAIMQWRILDRLAGFHQHTCEDVLKKDAWHDYREVVLKTRLTPMDRNKLYDGEEK